MLNPETYALLSTMDGGRAIIYLRWLAQKVLVEPGVDEIDKIKLARQYLDHAIEISRKLTLSKNNR